MDMGLVAALAIVGVSLLIVVVPMIPFLKRQAEGARLQAQGESAQAQILSAQETGSRLNDQPEVLLVSNVQRRGQAPYQAQATAVVSNFMIPRLQP